MIRFAGSAHRILLVDNKRAGMWLYNLELERWPVFVKKACLDDDGEARSGPELKDTWRASLLPLNDDRLEYARKNFEIIEPLVGDEENFDVFEPGARLRALQAQARAFATTRQTVANLLRRYWRGGMTLHALVPLFSNRGAPGKKRLSVQNPLGRPRTINQQPKLVVDETVAKIFDKGIKHYNEEKSLSFTDAYQHILDTYFTKRTNVTTTLISPYPTEAQFSYYYKTSMPRATRARLKSSERHWRLNARPITGRGDQKVLGPGHRFQIDATVWDVYLRSALDRRRIVGRPTVYLVVDEFSRLIVGFYVGLEAASWAAASLALINMVTPKVEFCRSLGICIVESDWPAAVAPARLLADRGELFSLSVGGRLEALRITIDNAASWRADWKSIVESRFRILPAKFKRFVPGVVEKDWGQRGAKDPRIHSKLTLRSFEKIVVRAILQHNRKAIEEYRLMPEMVTDGLVASPNNLWRWGIANLSGQPKSISAEEMSLAVLHEGTAKITPRGILTCH